MINIRLALLLLSPIIYNVGFSASNSSLIPAGLSKSEWNNVINQINGAAPNANQDAYIKASNTGSGDSFGYSVAISGDTLVVGANKEDSTATGVNNNQDSNAYTSSGAAYVFTRSAGVWSQQTYLKASNTNNGDEFGFSVGISGDTIVVGAAFEDSNATGINNDGGNDLALQSGAAYVFTRNAGIWSQQAYLKASNTGLGDWFGYSVAISGDAIVVGAALEDSDTIGVNNGINELSNDSGAAYVFTRDSGEWTQQAFLKASNTEVQDLFGYAVDIFDDTIVVGAFLEDSNSTIVNGDDANNFASQSGAAYVYTRTVDTWSQQAYLKPNNTGADDRFGCSVAINTDTLVVGAEFESSNALGVNNDGSNDMAFQSGAAYIFKRNSGIWSQQAYLKASNTGVGDLFGYSVDIDNHKVVVGARYEDSNSAGVGGDGDNDLMNDSGAAYVYISTAGDWNQQDYLKSFNPGTNDVFGFSVAISDNNIVIGAEWESSNSTGVNNDGMNDSMPFSGAVYVFNEKVIFVNGFE